MQKFYVKVYDTIEKIMVIEAINEDEAVYKATREWEKGGLDDHWVRHIDTDLSIDFEAIPFEE